MTVNAIVFSSITLECHRLPLQGINPSWLLHALNGIRKAAIHSCAIRTNMFLTESTIDFLGWLLSVWSSPLHDPSISQDFFHFHLL